MDSQHSQLEQTAGLRQQRRTDSSASPGNQTGKPLLFRPTVIVVHPRERRAKCSVRPLRSRTDFAFCNFPRMPYDLTGYVRLGLGGPLLDHMEADCGLLVLDGTWRHVEPMQRSHAAIPVRSLPPLQTAYPRSSKVRSDPDGGLATIEAIYAAYRLLGRDTAGLLDHYHWADEFVEQNQMFWVDSQHTYPQCVTPTWLPGK